jgi:hypothetical protein
VAAAENTKDLKKYSAMMNQAEQQSQAMAFADRFFHDDFRIQYL